MRILKDRFDNFKTPVGPMLKRKRNRKFYPTVLLKSIRQQEIQQMEALQ